MIKPKNSVNILLIEDNPGDVRLTQEAFRECSPDIHLDVVMDGEEALSYLRREEGYQDRPLPNLILLDLNLPKWNGKDVLKAIKSDGQLCHIPVVVLTTSTAEQDIRQSYQLHANCYLNKPVDFDQFFEVIKRIEMFWVYTAVLPSASE